ncbi:MAG TPA: biopolymer transporter ExbD [Myxococcaceae bacterium]|jgi:biopolymer transport protein ExbD/biopolymer transport protein TolR
MRFSSGSRPTSDINVTPLVDVVLVLLIIFMVVTPLVEKDIEVHLPEEQQDDPEGPAQQLVVQITASGELVLNAEHLSMEELGGRLKKVLRARPRGERLVFFLPEEKASYGMVVEVLSTAKTSGADILGMVTIDLSAQQVAVPAAGATTPPP